MSRFFRLKHLQPYDRHGRWDRKRLRSYGESMARAIRFLLIGLVAAAGAGCASIDRRAADGPPTIFEWAIGAKDEEPKPAEPEKPDAKDDDKSENGNGTNGNGAS